VSLYSPDGSLLVRDLSFQVVTGQSVIIMGPNGRYVRKIVLGGKNVNFTYGILSATFCSSQPKADFFLCTVAVANLHYSAFLRSFGLCRVVLSADHPGKRFFTFLR
jgi:hypothetical protein